MYAIYKRGLRPRAAWCNLEDRGLEASILKADERGKVRVSRTANEPKAHFTRMWRVRER
jgi:hypothetical protein